MDDSQNNTAPAEPAGMPTVEDEIAALRAQAEEASDANRPADALPFLTRWVELAPDDPEPLLLRAWEHRWAGDPVAARADIEQAEGRFPQSGRVAVEAGELYGDLEAFEDADAALNRAAPLIGDDDHELLLRLADDYEEAEMPEQALAVYARLQKLRPYEALRGSARVRRDLGDPAGALRDLDAALAAFPPDQENPNMILAWMWSDRAAIQRDLTDLAGAEASARHVLDLTEDRMLTSDALTMVAEIAREQGDRAGARAAAEDALTRDARYFPAWQTLISCALEDSDAHGALDMVHRAQKQLPTNAELVTTAALLQAQLGNIDGILGEWARLIEADPENAEAPAMRATLALGLGHPDIARADADRALQLDPNNSMALETRARLLLADHDARGALAAVTGPLQAAPDNVTLLLLRGDIHMALHNPLATAADYARVVALDPDNYQGQAGMGHVQMLLGRYDGALQSYQAALRLAPDAGGALYNVAAAYATLGRCAQCVSYLRRAVAADPAVAEDAQEDEFLDPCRRFPSLAATLRGEGASSAGSKGKKGTPKTGKPPRSQRK
jgi:tetratricopeptide (TPR) repeat protein